MNTSLTSFIESLDAASLEEAKTLFSDFIASFGMTTFAYAGLRGTGFAGGERHVVTSFPQEWVAFYQQREFEAIDPVLIHAARSVAPVEWGDLLYAPEVTAKQKRIFHEARNHGLKSGLTIPIHAPNQFAIVSVATGTSDAGFHRALIETRHLLHLGALYYHERIAALRRQQTHKDGVRLGKRERECLLWAAQGKTAWETGEILNISQNTVKQYLKSSIRKLGVSSKSHAVVKAIMLCLIFP